MKLLWCYILRRYLYSGSFLWCYIQYCAYQYACWPLLHSMKVIIFASTEDHHREGVSRIKEWTATVGSPVGVDECVGGLEQFIVFDLMNRIDWGLWGFCYWPPIFVGRSPVFKRIFCLMSISSAFGKLVTATSKIFEIVAFGYRDLFGLNQISQPMENQRMVT